MKAKLGDRFHSDFRAFPDNDVALEWCEIAWLDERLPARSTRGSAPIDSYDLFRGLTPEQIRLVAGLLQHRCYRQNEVIIEMGAEANEVFFLSRGSAMITLTLAHGAQRRLGVFSPGMAFGEVGMLDGAPRSAVVTAQSDVECHLLKREDFEALGEIHPQIKITLLKNMALGIGRLLRKSTREIIAFDY
jgi:glutaminase